MGVSVDYDNEDRHRNTEDIFGETLQEVDGHLYFVRGGTRHPVRVMATTAMIRVGCVSLSRKAWETLKRKIDRVPS